MICKAFNDTSTPTTLNITHLIPFFTQSAFSRSLLMFILIKKTATSHNLAKNYWENYDDTTSPVRAPGLNWNVVATAAARREGALFAARQRRSVWKVLYPAARSKEPRPPSVKGAIRLNALLPTARCFAARQNRPVWRCPNIWNNDMCSCSNYIS